MSDLRGVSVGLLAVVTLVAGGCGSSTKTTTGTVATTSVATSAPTTENPQPATQGTSTTTQHHATVAPETPLLDTTTQPEVNRGGHDSKTSTEEAKPISEAAKQQITKLDQVPKLRQYDPGTQHAFIKSCTAQRASTASCECIVIKFELMNGEKTKSFAELFALEYGIVHREPLPSSAAPVVAHCKGPTT